MPILERVHAGAVTVTHNEYRQVWYYDDSQQCRFTTYLLGVLVEQRYCRWDSMIGEIPHLRARDDGIWAVKADDKGRELHARLRARSAC